MKGNDGRAARKKLTRQLAFIVGGFVILLAVLTFLGVGGKKGNLRDSASAYAKDHLARIRDTAAKASDFRNDLRNQFKQRHEGEILEEILSGHLHLIDLQVVEEELLSAPPNSYAGIYGVFCRLDWSLHKKDPSRGACAGATRATYFHIKPVSHKLLYLHDLQFPCFET